jgi:hypothetical protein
MRPRARRASSGPLTRSALGFTCPRCATATADPAAARLGYCAACREFTGRCAAGGQVSLTGISFDPGPPCAERGTVAWRVTTGDRRVIEVWLCARHDGEVAAGLAPWLRGTRLGGSP